jgi:ABC-type lipoprotein release transport system permease subunit
VIAITSISILLTILATIYPSIKASSTSPAEALKHD